MIEIIEMSDKLCSYKFISFFIGPRYHLELMSRRVHLNMQTMQTMQTMKTMQTLQNMQNMQDTQNVQNIQDMQNMRNS